MWTSKDSQTNISSTRMVPPDHTSELGSKHAILRGLCLLSLLRANNAPYWDGQEDMFEWIQKIGDGFILKNYFTTNAERTAVFWAMASDNSLANASHSMWTISPQDMEPLALGPLISSISYLIDSALSRSLCSTPMSSRWSMSKPTLSALRMSSLRKRLLLLLTTTMSYGIVSVIPHIEGQALVLPQFLPPPPGADLPLHRVQDEAWETNWGGFSKVLGGDWVCPHVFIECFFGCSPSKKIYVRVRCQRVDM